MSKSKNKTEDETEGIHDEPTSVNADSGADSGVENASADADTEEPTDESSEAEEPAELEAVKTPHERLTEERDKLQLQLQRTLADLQNFRKRRAQEMTEVRRTTIEAMATELLPVLDNFHLAMTYGTSTGEAAMKSMQDGLEMIRGMLESVFVRHGVEEIPSHGEKFDPLVHEAVGIDPDPDAEEGLVTQILQKGYKIDGKVIRPTRVMVGGAPPVAAGEDGDS